MLPYWLLLGFFSVGALAARPDARRDKSLGLLALAWVVLALMIGLRWEVGPDWESYYWWWQRAGDMPLFRFVQLARSDPVFYAIMWFLRDVNASYWMLNALMAAVFATGLVQFARAQVNPWLAIAIATPWLVIVIGMSGIRQAAAISFVFLGILALQRQEGWKFVGWITAAASFHASAILILPLAGLSFTRSRLVAAFLIFLVAVGSFYFLDRTFTVYSERYFSRIDESTGTLHRIGMTMLPAVLYFVYRRHLPAEPHERSFWRNLSLVGLLAIPLYFFVQSSTALDRLLLYLFPLQMYVLSALPSIVGARMGKLLITGGILFYLALQLFVFMNYGVNRVGFLPYQTIFSEDAN